MHLAQLILIHPWKTLKFLYTWSVSSFLVVLKGVLLPHVPVYQGLCVGLQRAYLSSAAVTFPDLVHRLPVGPLPETEAFPLKSSSHGFEGYLIPGTKAAMLKEFASHETRQNKCIILYAHGGGYAKGEAKMYLKYMKRWERVAMATGLDLVFLSVEYPLSHEQPHPAQRDAFLSAYRYLLDQGIQPGEIVFMGDSAGAGICILSGIQSLDLGLPQPACSVLHSPWIDPTMPAHEGGNALVETDYLVAANSNVPDLWKKWLGGLAPTATHVNPLYHKPSQIGGLNPQLIFVGAGEFALHEGKDWRKLCEEGQVENSLICEPQQMHIFSLGSDWLSASVRNGTDATIFRWITNHLRRRKNSSG